MCARKTMWTLLLCLLAFGATASAQQRIPLACQGDPRTLPASCARYLPPAPVDCRQPQSQSLVACGPLQQNGRPAPVIRQAPPSRGQTRYVESQPDPAAEKIRDAFVDWGKGEIRDAMPEPRTKRGKRIADGYDLYSDPAGYLIEKELAKRRGEEAAKRAMKKFVNPIGTGLDIVTTPIHNPKGYKDGQSGRPSNAETAGLAYDGLQKGACVPRALLNGGPSAAPVPSGGPAPGPSPGNFCASVDELTSYVNRYQKELEEIARREMADWMAPRDSMQAMTEMIAQIERQLQNPAIDPELRRWAQQELRSLKQAYDESYKRGVRPPDGAGAQPVPFANDPVHRAGQRIDSELSIKPWR